MKTIDLIKKECNVIIRVADARNPKTLFPFRTKKRTIIVFNKIDICTDEKLNALRKKYKSAVFVSTRTRKGKAKMIKMLSMIAKKEKGLIRVGVVGYPNVGKSSIINMLRGKRSARVSATPGETKGVQWLKIKDGILMYDTPGVITHWQNEKSLVKAFAITAENAKDPEGIAEHILKVLKKKHGIEWINNKYGIECSESTVPNRILEKIAKRYNMMMKGGEPDLDRASKKIIRDWQREMR